MSLVMAVSDTIDDAVTAGEIRPGDGLARAIVWLMAFGGVFAADDLEQYVPGVLGGGRLVRQLNVDLLVGWGAAPHAVQRIEAAVDVPGTHPSSSERPRRAAHARDWSAVARSSRRCTASLA
jgi:hypothetical protein